MPTVTSQGKVIHRNPVDWIVGTLVISTYTMRAAGDPAPRIAATKSNPATPTSPQFRAPIVAYSILSGIRRDRRTQYGGGSLVVSARCQH